MKKCPFMLSPATTVPFPPSCSELQYECELVVAIGEGGANIPVEEALRSW